MQTLGLSDSTPKPASLVRELLWPQIDSDIAAVTAARNAMYVDFVLAAVSALAWFGASGAQAIGVSVDVALYLMVGIGVRQLSRAAALTGFVIYGLSWVVMSGNQFLSFWLVPRLLGTVLLLNGVRAAVYAHSAFKQDAIAGIANPQFDTTGASMASVALEQAPKRLWPLLRTPFLIMLGLLVLLVSTEFTLAIVGQPYRSMTGSMEKTLLPGDTIYCLRRPWMGPVRRGDLVAHLYPVDRRQIFFKRVVGMPGDRIRIVNKELFLNGAHVSEPYAEHVTGFVDSYRDNFPSPPNINLLGDADLMLANFVRNGEVVVPAGFYFVLGDNRDQSLDSRYWGFLSDADVQSRPLLILYSYDKNVRRPGRALLWLPRPSL